MSQPKVTLAECIAKMDEAPTSPDYELAVLEFLEKSDAEQKRILFKAVVQLAASFDWITKGRLR